MTSPLSIAMAVVLGIICLASGLLLGAMPMQNSKMTERQRRVSSLLCFIIAIVYIVLLFSGQDIPTWTMLRGIFAGFGIGKIPPVHNFLVSKWDFLKPYEPKKSKQRRRK